MAIMLKIHNNSLKPIFSNIVWKLTQNNYCQLLGLSILFVLRLDVVRYQFYIKLVCKNPLSFTLRIRIWVVAYKFLIKKSIFFVLWRITFSNLVRTLKYLKKCSQKVEKKLSKALSCPNGPNRRIYVPKMWLIDQLYTKLGGQVLFAWFMLIEVDTYVCLNFDKIIFSENKIKESFLLHNTNCMNKIEIQIFQWS